LTNQEKITFLVESYTKQMQDWFNADVERREVESFAQLFHDDWKIVHKKLPGFTGNKENYLNHWKTGGIYGKHKDDKIKYSFSNLEITELSDVFFLVTFIQEYEFSLKSNKWPLTMIVMYEEKTEKMVFYYTHE
jgi:hypothetical protein